MPNPISEALRLFFDDAKYPIVFTGAGVSARAGLPTWGKLIERLAEGIRGSDPLVTQIMYERAREGYYTNAVDVFNSSPKMLAGEKQKLLQSLLSKFDVNPILPVAGLPVRGCLTTNFDRSILDAFARKLGEAPRDYKHGDVSFKQAQWEEDFFVARIHGSVEVSDSMVLSEAQFNTLLADDTYADLLRTCFTQRDVLFLGFSFYDPAVRYVFEDLDRRFGGASPGRHLALLPSDASSDFTRKAARLNIKVVQYDSDNDHAALWTALSEFSTTLDRRAVVAQSSKSTPFDFTKRYLAACYSRAKSLGSSTALREAVLEGIVSALLQEKAPQAIGRKSLLEKIRLALGLKGHDTESVLDNAVKSLVDAGLCRKLKASGSQGINFAWIGAPSELDSLDAAIEVLANSVKSRAYLQEGWKTGPEVKDSITAFFKELVRRRGWDLGAAFAAGRPPNTVAIQSLLTQCAVGLSTFDRERLCDICENMLQHPSQDEAAILNELGRVSFAVEMAFQSPRSVLLHKAVLPRCIYFDASVLLPALVLGHPYSQLYLAAIKRLRKAASTAAVTIKFKVCTVYLNEIVSHRRNAEEYFAQFGKDFPAVARSDALYHGATNVNVYVGAYANWLANHEPIDFDKFLGRVAPFTNELQLRRWLTTQGFEIVDGYKGPKYPAFYSLLEKGYAQSLEYGKGPILIEHDAIQLSLLDSDLLRGERALFVTADRKLQSVTAENNFSGIAGVMISHVGLVQFIELLLGGLDDGAGLTELLWSAAISDRARAVRSYFITLGLEQYDEAMALAMPEIIEKYTDAATQELSRVGADLDTDDPKKRADAFRVLGTLEKNYLAGMHEAAEKLRKAADFK